jgi:hypothetical protein
MTADDTHTKVLIYLRDRLPKTDDFARVYVFSDLDQPNIIKIGIAQSPSERKDIVVKGCKFRDMTVHFESEIMEANVASKVETLAHYELGFFRRPFDCPACPYNHREFFELDWQVAKSVVERWIRFLKLKPYDADGTLKEGWKAKMSKYIGQNRPEQNHENHDDRGKWWEQLAEILAPPVIQEAEVLESNSWKPPTCSVIQALVLFLTTSNWWIRVPNLIGIIVAWLLMDSYTSALVRKSIPQVHIPRLHILRQYVGAPCKGS